MFSKLFFISFFSLFIFSCGFRIGESSLDLLPYEPTNSLIEKCRDVDYAQTFVSYFHQEVMASVETLQRQNEQIDEAFSCIKGALTQITSEIRGEQTDSLSKSEFSALLRAPSTQKLLQEKGFKNMEIFVNKLQEPEYLNRFMEIKNFIVEIINHFSDGLSSKKVCNSTRDRFYKWEVEVLISFLDVLRNWMKEVHLTSEAVYANLIENILSKSPFDFKHSYFGPFQFKEKYIVRKSLFTVAEEEHTLQYIRPALVAAFADKAPDFSNYLLEPVVFPQESFWNQIPWNYFSSKAQRIHERKTRGKQFSQAISHLIESNTANPSGFLANSDIQFIVMNASITHTLFSAYDVDQNFQVTRKEFYQGTACLEDFLLPLFKNNKEALHYFIEFQKSPGENQNLPSYYWNKLVGDEDFSLSQDDLFKLNAVLIAAFFPYSLIERGANTNNTDALFALKQPQ